MSSLKANRTHPECHVLKAKWVYDGSSLPVENGLVAIADGRIVDIPQVIHEVEDLGNVALIPGLINAHTHLEFSGHRNPVEPRREFANWIRAVIRSRSERTGSDTDSGLLESRLSGTTFLAEIATSNWYQDLPGQQFSSGVMFFREYLGLSAERIDLVLAQAREDLSAFRRDKARLSDEGAELIYGISPHAPYSLHPQLFNGLCDFAQTEQLPVAMHLAESPEELELLSSGTGPLVDLFKEMGIWRENVIPLRTTPRDYLNRLAELPRVLVVHGNYLTAEDQQFLARHKQMSVVYCPRTQAAMQSDSHPWQTMLEQGVNVVIGTDSRASNPDLSIWRELQFLKEKTPAIRDEVLLSLATTNSARGLGLVDRGGLKTGQIADLCVVKLPEATDRVQTFSLFDGEIVRSMIKGRWF